MTVIHAFRRTRPATIEFGGEVVQFKANAAGEFVAEPQNPATVDRLLEISEAYRVHGVPVEAPDDEGSGLETSPYVLTQEGEAGAEVTIDLRKLTRAQLLEFCAENEIPAPSAQDKVGEIRDAIVAFFKVE